MSMSKQVLHYHHWVEIRHFATRPSYSGSTRAGSTVGSGRGTTITGPRHRRRLGDRLHCDPLVQRGHDETLVRKSTIIACLLGGLTILGAPHSGCCSR